MTREEETVFMDVVAAPLTLDAGPHSPAPPKTWTVEDPEWVMHWSATSQAKGKPAEEAMLDDARALAVLLVQEAVFLNDHWWEDAWPEKARATASLNVNCNDVFAWGCSDAEEMVFADLEEVWRHWRKDPAWGTAIWCMKKRRELPQSPVADSIRKAGIWDLDGLAAEFGLRSNHYDGCSGVVARRKYEAYCAWERERGKGPRPFDAQWWAGWMEYTAANPGWWNDEWKAADAAARTEFRRANGWMMVVT